MRDGGRVTARGFVLHYAPRDDRGPARVGLSVPRRVGGAVARNKIRRLLREAARPLSRRLKPCDLVVVARPEIANLGLRELESSLRDAASRSGLILSDS